MKKIFYISGISLILGTIGFFILKPDKPYEPNLNVGASYACTVDQGCTGTTTFAQDSFLYGNVQNAIGATSTPFFTNFTFLNATGTSATTTNLVVNNLTLPTLVASSVLAVDPQNIVTYIPNGTANQVFAMNTGATQAVFKTISAVANETTVAQNNTQINIGIADPLIGSKGGTGFSTVGVNQLLYGSIANTWTQSAALNFDGTMFGVGTTTPRFQISSSGDIGGSNIYLASTTFQATSTLNHNLVFAQASSTIYHAYRPTGNATYGTTTLSSGSATVNTTMIRTAPTSTVFITPQNCVSCGTPFVSSITNGTSFVIGSTNGSDASEVAWFIIQPF